MPSEPPAPLRLEIGHVLFIDIVGYSRLLINEQTEVLGKLNDLVRATPRVCAAEAENKLIRLPSGDGMALVFRDSPESPAHCALEISAALKAHPEIPVRMGIHSGPINEIADVNERANIAGAGINIAQRVMDCGDAGHILVSRRVADDLAQYREWQPCLHNLGECEVKHGVRVAVANLHTGELGNPAVPQKFRATSEAPPPRAAWHGRPRALILAGGGLALMLLLALLLWLTPRPAAARQENRIAILPFKPLVAENSDPALELGMADSLITKLSNSRDLIVPSLTSVRQYAGVDQDAVAAGRNLGVASVLEGNVQKAGDRLRVTARLIKIPDGSSLWAGTFDEKFTDVFAVQETISRKVADALALQLSGLEKERFAKRYTDNVDAYQLYLTGRFHWNKLTPPEIRKSIEFFERAIRLDPNYALAHFGLAESYRTLSVTSDRPARELLPPSKSAALKAVQLDEALAEAHASLVYNYIWFEWNWALAEQEAKRAVALNPNSGIVRLAHAHFLSDVGRHDEAIAEVRRARELDPTSLIINTLEGAFLYSARRDDEAALSLQKALELEPNFWVAHLFLGNVHTRRRNFADAIAAYTRARDLSFGNSQAIAMIGYVSALSGDTAHARSLLEELRTRAAQDYVPPANIAHLHHALGENDEAFRLLERAFEEHDVFLSFLKVDPKWDALRGDPRFQSLLQRIGFE